MARINAEVHATRHERRSKGERPSRPKTVTGILVCRVNIDAVNHGRGGEWQVMGKGAEWSSKRPHPARRLLISPMRTSCTPLATRHFFLNGRTKIRTSDLVVISDAL